MGGKRPVLQGFSDRHVHIILEVFQELQQAIPGFEARNSAFGGLEFAQATLFHLQVQLDVMMCRGGGFVSQQQSDDHDIDIRLEQAQGRGVPEGVRRNSAVFQGWTALDGSLHRLLQPLDHAPTGQALTKAVVKNERGGILGSLGQVVSQLAEYGF
jgi:hypothetical protein